MSSRAWRILPCVAISFWILLGKETRDCHAIRNYEARNDRPQPSFLNALSSRCLSFLNGSTRNPNKRRGHPYGSKTKEKAKTFGFPPSFVTPAIFKPGSTVFKNQRKSKNMDSHHPSSPRQSLSRGPQYFKIWIPDKKFRE